MVILESFDAAKNQAIVRNGKVKINVKLEELFHLKDAPSSQKLLSSRPLKVDKRDEKVTINVDYETTGQVRYDCRGMRHDTFIDTLENIKGQLFAGVIPFADIIHGHGDGILKSALRRFIKENSDHLTGQSENGNDGSTLIKIK